MDKHVEVTQVLLEASSGREGAADRLWSLVYDELRRIAHQQLRSERDRRHLSTTALVHEAYLRLVDESRITWKNRSHFFGVATMVMRQVLVDNARKYLAQKRGGGQRNATFDEGAFVTDDRAQEIIDLDDALNKLAAFNERWSKVVECLYFGGLTQEEAAGVLGVSVRTVERDWKHARAWLYNVMRAPVKASS